MAIIYQGLLQWGIATVLPVRDVQLSPAVIRVADQSAGDANPTAQSLLGASPAITCTMPAGIAIDTFGATADAETALVSSLLKVDSATGAVAAAGGNVRFSLQTSCLAYGMIDTIGVNQHGYATASCSIFLISNNGITTNPIARAAGAALSLAANPSLSTFGPITVNGSAISGAKGATINLAHDFDVDTSDGDKYPTAFGHHSVAASIEVPHGDPDAVITALGLDGAAIASTTKIQLYDVASGVVAATGRSLTFSAGAVTPMAVGGGVQGRAMGGLMIAAASAPSFGTF